jgi:xanthine/uracil permease
MNISFDKIAMAALFTGIAFEATSFLSVGDSVKWNLAAAGMVLLLAAFLLGLFSWHTKLGKFVTVCTSCLFAVAGLNAVIFNTVAKRKAQRDMIEHTSPSSQQK